MSSFNKMVQTSSSATEEARAPGSGGDNEVEVGSQGLQMIDNCIFADAGWSTDHEHHRLGLGRLQDCEKPPLV